MKTNAIVRIIIWSIVLTVLIGILVSFLLLPYGLLSRKHNEITHQAVPLQPGDPESSFTGSMRVPAADYSNLKIQWAAGNITILPKEGITEIQVQEDAAGASRYTMFCKTSGNTLVIRFCEEDLRFSILDTDITKDLIITVPADWVCRKLELDVAASDLLVQELTIREVDFDGASGTCDFADCIIEELDMDTASGDVTFRGELKRLDFDAASASFRGEFRNTPDSIDMDGMSGELDIALPEDCGYTLYADGLSSRCSSEFIGAEVRNGAFCYGDGRCRINVDGMAVDVNIRKLDSAIK